MQMRERESEMEIGRSRATTQNTTGTKQTKTKVEEKLIKPFLHIVENEPAEKKSSLLLAAGLGERSEGSWGE